MARIIVKGVLLVASNESSLIPMCLCFITRRSNVGQYEVLLGRKKTGFGQGKIVGLGGHLEPGETPRAATVREVREEAGIIINESSLREMARVTFRFPRRPIWDQFVTVYETHQWQGNIIESTEITPMWYAVQKLPLRDMWDDARYWLPEILMGQRLEVFVEFGDDNQTLLHRSIQPLTVSE